MLVVAVGVAAFLKDEPGYKAGSSEISGKLVGLTAFQEDKAELSSSGTAEDDRTQKPLPSAVRADNEAAPDTKLLKNDGRGAISAPFDTRPASVETDSAEEPPSVALARQAEEPEKKVARSVTSSVVRDGSASAAGKKSEAEQSSGQESSRQRPYRTETGSLPEAMPQGRRQGKTHRKSLRRKTAVPGSRMNGS